MRSSSSAIFVSNGHLICLGLLGAVFIIVILSYTKPGQPAN